MYWWVKFEERKPACIEAKSEEDALARARELVPLNRVMEIDALPYPAEPRLNRTSICPSFCWTPERCAGRTSCPRRPCCTS